MIVCGTEDCREIVPVPHSPMTCGDDTASTGDPTATCEWRSELEEDPETWHSEASTRVMRMQRRKPPDCRRCSRRLRYPRANRTKGAATPTTPTFSCFASTVHIRCHGRKRCEKNPVVRPKPGSPTPNHSSHASGAATRNENGNQYGLLSLVRTYESACQSKLKSCLVCTSVRK